MVRIFLLVFRLLYFEKTRFIGEYIMACNQKSKNEKGILSNSSEEGAGARLIDRFIPSETRMFQFLPVRFWKSCHKVS